MPARPTSDLTSPSLLNRIYRSCLPYTIEIILIAAILYLCISRGMAITVDIHEPESTPAAAAQPALEASFGGGDAIIRWIGSLLTDVVEKRETDTLLNFTSVARTSDPAPHIPNLTLVLSPDYGERKGLPDHIIAGKRKRVSDYVARHAPAAIQEMRAYGIPASITLAQALLESNAGDSKLAVDSKNHFGIKCRRKCLGCTCRNYGDDTRYDMFRVFASVEESFREHSVLLNSPRYARLHNYGLDYRRWAHGLKACGYATDPRYAEKLIQIVEELDLKRYDG